MNFMSLKGSIGNRWLKETGHYWHISVHSVVGITEKGKTFIPCQIKQ